MRDILAVLAENNLIPSAISAVSILMGAIVGGFCSWIVNKKILSRNEKIQIRIAEENRRCEEKNRLKKICENASIVRLDICTTLYQSIRSIKNINEESPIIYPIAISSNFSCSVASLEDHFGLRELSYIYQLYGIIEKINHDIKNNPLGDKDSCRIIGRDYELFLQKIYGENYKEILKLDVDCVTYKELYDNKLIKSGYKRVLQRLDDICIMEQKGSDD
jgi:hypothetical protein